MSEKDGGWAFPNNERSYDGSHYYSHVGMSLRDYFAAQALALMFPEGNADFSSEMNEPDLDKLFAMTARYAYRMADAMLKARSS